MLSIFADAHTCISGNSQRYWVMEVCKKVANVVALSSQDGYEHRFKEFGIHVYDESIQMGSDADTGWTATADNADDDADDITEDSEIILDAPEQLQQQFVEEEDGISIDEDAERIRKDVD